MDLGLALSAPGFDWEKAMSHGEHAIIMAVIEAKKKKQEEREMTAYTAKELQKDWEFKILRSAVGAFGKRETIEQVLAEETAAGWVLVEKFDDNRLRFKRPASAKHNDHNLPAHINPYRTTTGNSKVGLAFTLFGILAGVAALIGMLISLLG
jgi:hypothetical protein